MKNRIKVAALLLGSAVAACAATPGGAGMRDSLTSTDNLAPFSAGIDYQMIKRSVSLDNGGKNILQARIYSAEVGVDLFSRWQVFGTLGSSEASLENYDYGDNKVKWSGGTHLNWWHYDIEDPEFMEGRLSFQTTAEFSQFRSGNDTSWVDGYADLTLNYEIYVEKPKDIKLIPYSLALYGGVALSKLSGKADSQDFTEDRVVGVVGGADLYIAHNVSVGAQVLYFDNASFSFSARYHF